MIYYCDNYRHLICVPYSINNLHIMAKKLNIGKHFYHEKGRNLHPHYDIPYKRKKEIMSKCILITSKKLLTIINNQI